MHFQVRPNHGPAQVQLVWVVRVEKGRDNKTEPSAKPKPTNGECNSVYTMLQSLKFSVIPPTCQKKKKKN